MQEMFGVARRGCIRMMRDGRGRAAVIPIPRDSKLNARRPCDIHEMVPWQRNKRRREKRENRRTRCSEAGIASDKEDGRLPQVEHRAGKRVDKTVNLIGAPRLSVHLARHPSRWRLIAADTRERARTLGTGKPQNCTLQRACVRVVACVDVATGASEVRSGRTEKQ